jgi:hypothetical protein
MAILRCWLGIAILAAASAMSSWACFSPRQPGCAFSCVADGRCPSGYSCESDGLCHRDDGLGVCDFPSQNDAAADAGND